MFYHFSLIYNSRPFLVLFAEIIIQLVVIQGTEPQCHCVKGSVLKCREQATVENMCNQCHNEHCVNVSKIYFSSKACLAKNLTSCCPHVTEITVNDPSLCDCYCNISNVKLEISSKNGTISPCNCNNQTTTTSTTTSTTSTTTTKTTTTSTTTSTMSTTTTTPTSTKSTTPLSTPSDPVQNKNEIVIISVSLVFGALAVFGAIFICYKLRQRQIRGAPICCQTNNYELVEHLTGENV